MNLVQADWAWNSTGYCQLPPPATTAILSAERITTREIIMPMMMSGQPELKPHYRPGRDQHPCIANNFVTRTARGSGFAEQHGNKRPVRADENMNEIKIEAGMPRQLAPCHTARTDGYVIEGMSMRNRRVWRMNMGSTPVYRAPATGMCQPGQLHLLIRFR